MFKKIGLKILVLSFLLLTPLVLWTTPNGYCMFELPTGAHRVGPATMGTLTAVDNEDLTVDATFSGRCGPNTADQITVMDDYEADILPIALGPDGMEGTADDGSGLQGTFLPIDGITLPEGCEPGPGGTIIGIEIVHADIISVTFNPATIVANIVVLFGI